MGATLIVSLSYLGTRLTFMCISYNTVVSVSRDKRKSHLYLQQLPNEKLPACSQIFDQHEYKWEQILHCALESTAKKPWVENVL